MNANEWETIANSKKDTYTQPRWRFDCGFKLDFDGPLLSVESRFYPPVKNRGDWWEGTMSINLLGQTIREFKFKENTLELLFEKVEGMMEHFSSIVKARIS